MESRFLKIAFILGLNILTLCQASELAKTRCTLYNGRCTYRVQLFNGCQGDASPDVMDEMTSSEVEQLAGEGAGADSAQLRALERQVRDLEAHLNKRISDLKRTVDDLNSLALPRDDADSYWQNFDPYGRPSDHIEEHLDTRGFSAQTRPEDGLLRRVHDEFSIIREELEQTRRDLDEKERVLAVAQAEMVNSRVECDVTTNDVNELKEQLQAKEDENRLLREELERATQQLESRGSQLEQVEAERGNLQRFVEEKLAENDQLKETVSDCELELRNRDVATTGQQADAIRALEERLLRERANLQSVAMERDQFYDELCLVRDQLEDLTTANEANAKALQDCRARKIT